MWYPGQKIVCVNTGIIEGALNAGLDSLKEGTIYRIDRIVSHLGAVGFWLCEIQEPLVYDEPPWWREERFRPLDERDMDISVFTDILKKIEVVELV